jgi:acetyl esterase/lipase
MPAGASLISPWVDLTHSFPSINIPSEFDYVPAHGFHAKPSLAWPPPTAEEMEDIGMNMNPALKDDYEIELDGQPHLIKGQIQMYAPNLQLQIPLVSGILSASLGGKIAFLAPSYHPSVQTTVTEN